MKIKIGEMLDIIKDEEFTQVSDQMRIRWLEELDFKVRNDIYMNYEDDEGADFEGYDYASPEIGNAELLIPKAHRDVYELWVAAKCDLITGDTQRYQNHMIAFNAAWDNFVNEYNRTHEWRR